MRVTAGGENYEVLPQPVPPLAYAHALSWLLMSHLRSRLGLASMSAADQACSVVTNRFKFEIL